MWKRVSELSFDPDEAGQQTLVEKPQKPQTCRFCQRTAPVVKFKKVAHAFPEALGNRYIVHPAECDECNEKGSVLEDALAKHLSVQRAVARIRGKKGAVKYRFGKQPSSIVSDRKANLVTFETVEGDDSIWATRVPGAIRYHVRVPPYSPEKAAKAVARIGLFLVPSEILLKLDHIRRWVRSELEFSPEFHEGWVPGPGVRRVSATLDVYFPESNERQVLNFMVSVTYGSTLLLLELPAEDGSQLRASPPQLKSPYPPHDVRWVRLKTSAPPVTGRIDSIDFTSPALKALPPLDHRDIAVGAYFRAERRGFIPGFEIQDWLETEQELLWRQLDQFNVPVDDVSDE